MRPARAGVRHVAPGTSLLALRTARTMTPIGKSASRPGRAGCPIRCVQTQENLEGQQPQGGPHEQEQRRRLDQKPSLARGQLQEAFEFGHGSGCGPRIETGCRCEDGAPGNAPNLAEPGAPPQCVAQAPAGAGSEPTDTARAPARAVRAGGVRERPQCGGCLIASPERPSQSRSMDQAGGPAAFRRARPRSTVRSDRCRSWRSRVPTWCRC
jgi:hypothetical protein